MKKTLTALAVAACAVVSGSAMASTWTASGTGGSVELGGILTPKAVATPWEVRTGGSVTGLNAEITPGAKSVDIPVTASIPVLAIRTRSNLPFHGGEFIRPRINYGDAVNLSGFTNNTTTLTLDVLDGKSNKIGTLSTHFSAGAVASTKGESVHQYALFASDPGDAFYGGLSNKSGGVNVDATPRLLTKLFPDIAEHYNQQGATGFVGDAEEVHYNVEQTSYRGYYASGIDAGQLMRITFNSPIEQDITWRAILPATVTYL